MFLDTIIRDKVYKGTLETLEFRGEPCVINTINAHSYCVAKYDHVFANALKHSDVLLPDGFSIVLANKLLFGSKIEKIAGADIHAHLLKIANNEKKRVFYLGASTTTLDLIEERIKKEFPNIIVSSYSPPFKASFSEEDSTQMIAKVNDFAPDFVFVGMTAPKQEKWVHGQVDKLNVKVIAQIGAVFDFFAGTVQRPSSFWRNLGLEWLVRAVRSPRLIRRNLTSNPKFIAEMLSFKFFKRGVL